MTVEELEIIVSAKIEQVKPQIQKVVREIKSAVKDTDGLGTELIGKIDTQKVVKNVSKAKKQIKDAFDPGKTSFINIEGYSKSLRNFTGNIDVHALKNKMQQVEEVFKGFKSMEDAGKIDGNLYEKILNNFQKISGVSNKQYTFNREATYNANRPEVEADELRKKRAQYNLLIETIKKHNSAINESKNKTDQLKQKTSESATHGKKLSNTAQQIKKHLSGAGNGAKLISSGLSKAKSMAGNVTAHLKVGLGQILRIAGSLIGLRAIYSGLRSVASSWLSSQNVQAQQLNTNIEYMKYALGSSLQPVIETIVNLIYQALKGVQSLIYALTGVNIFANASAKSYASMAKNAKKAKDETLKVADIDEIHNIQEDKDSSGSGAGTPSFDLSGIETADWLQKLIDNIKNGNWYEIGATIGTKINETLEKIPWDKIKRTASNAGKNVAQFLNGGIETTDWKLVGGTIAEGVNTAINFAHSFVTTFNWKAFGKSISDTINGFFEKIEWDKAGETISEGIKGLLDTLIEYVKNLDVSKIQDSVLDFLFNIDWAGVFGKLVELLSRLVIIGIEAPINIAIKAAKKLSKKLPPSMRGAFASLQEIHLEDSILEFGSYTAAMRLTQEQAKETAKETEKNIGELNTVTTETFDELEGKTYSWGENTAANYNKGVESQKPTTNTLFDKIKSVVQGDLNQSGNSKTWGSDTVSNYGTGANGKTSGVQKVFDWVHSVVRGDLNQSQSSKSWGSDTVSNYGSGASSQSSSLSNVFKNVKSVIQGMQISGSYSWGSDMLQGFINGINSKKRILTNTVSGLVGSISSFLHFSRPDKGPLRNYETWMPDMIKGLSDSLLKASPKLDNAVSQVSSNIADNLRATDLGVNVNSNINKTINSNILGSQLENAVYSAIQKAENLFRLTVNSELKLNSKTIAQEILDDLNNEAKRRGYRPILEH